MKRTFYLTTLAALSVALVTGCATKQHQEHSMNKTDSATKQTAATDDPHQWLEDVEGDKALDWVRARNKASQGHLEQLPGFKKVEQALLNVYDSDAKIPYISKKGGHVYNFWKDKKHQRGLWRRTTMDSYRSGNTQWETIIDLDQLAKAEDENWVWHGADCLRPTYDRCLVSLSRGGADADVMREFDMNSKTFVKGGFALPESKGGATWIDRDTLFVQTDFGDGSMTDSGYPRIVKVWKRGTPLSQAKTVFEGEQKDMMVGGSVSHSQGNTHKIIYRLKTFYTRDYFVMGDDEQLTKVDVPDHAQIDLWGDWMLIEAKEDWTVGGKTWPQGSLLVTKQADFFAGKRDFDALFTPHPTRSLSGRSATKDYLLVTELDNVKDRLYEWRHDDGKGWVRREVTVPGLGNLGVSSVDEDSSNDYFLTYSDFLTPDTLYLGKAGSNERSKLRSLPSFFDASGYEVKQHFTTSKDGTRVPYFQINKKGVTLDGSNPTLLYGYGGFEISLTPSYAATTGVGWLEQGGVYVLANIRGGGEFGPKWHRAALKENRQRAYDDFIAIGEDLIARKVTSSKHLGIQGGSNGGLLMGVMLTQRPDLWNAVVVQVPLLDMKRFNKLLAGASWMGEYGNPDKPEEWAYISKYSPYQNVKPGVDYPAVLFTTSTRDDRVHPGHARKMMAKMMAQGHDDLLYYENIEGGHGGAANNKQAAHMRALAYAFLAEKLGLTDGKH